MSLKSFSTPAIFFFVIIFIGLLQMDLARAIDLGGKPTSPSLASCQRQLLEGSPEKILQQLGEHLHLSPQVFTEILHWLVINDNEGKMGATDGFVIIGSRTHKLWSNLYHLDVVRLASTEIEARKQYVLIGSNRPSILNFYPDAWGGNPLSELLLEGDLIDQQKQSDLLQFMIQAANMRHEYLHMFSTNPIWSGATVPFQQVLENEIQMNLARHQQEAHGNPYFNDAIINRHRTDYLLAKSGYSQQNTSNKKHLIYSALPAVAERFFNSPWRNRKDLFPLIDIVFLIKQNSAAAELVPTLIDRGYELVFLIDKEGQLSR